MSASQVVGTRGLRMPASQPMSIPKHVDMLMRGGWEDTGVGLSYAVEWQRVLKAISLHGCGLRFAGTVTRQGWGPKQSWLGPERPVMPMLDCPSCLQW